MPDTVPTSPRSTTRRALLGGLTLGAAAVVAESVKPSAAQATQGQAVIAGELNFATQFTTISNIGTSGVTSGTALVVQAADFGGVALRAIANGPDGSPSVSAHSLSGNGVTAVTQSSATSGVYGQNDGGGYGVAGRSNSANGKGVLGEATGTGGIGLLGVATNDGAALVVQGKAKFDRSGKKTIPAGSSSAVVTLAGVTSSSLILATLQKHALGFAVESAVPTAGSFKIRLNKPAPTGGLPVAWFVIN